MVKFTIAPSGHLVISLDATKERRKELKKEYIKEKHYNSNDLFGVFEEIDGTGSPFCNGYSTSSEACHSIGLTKAPFITTNSPNDLGEYEFDESSELWVYLEYQVSDALYQLFEHGEVTFQKV